MSRLAEGPTCRRCKASEARCAYLASCCPTCTHWRYWTADGELVGPDALLDEVTLRRRVRERERSRARYAERTTGTDRHAEEGEARACRSVTQVDPVVVERLCAGLPTESNTKERREAVRRLHGWGLSDSQIADRIGSNGAAVFALRKRMGAAS